MPTAEEVKRISDDEQALATRGLKLSSSFTTVRLRRASNLSYSMPIIKKTITLHSNDAQSLLRHYDFASNSLFQMGITLRRYAPEENVDILRRHVFDEMINPLKAYIAEIATKYRNMPVPEAAKQNKVEYTKPATVDVEVSYPGALQLIELLVNFDGLLFHLTELWYAMEVDDGEYCRVKAEARTRLKEDEKGIERLVREAVRKAEKEALAREENADVEAGVKSLAAAAGKKSPANGRGRRTKAIEAAIPPAGPGEVEKAQGLGETVAKPGEEFSPFEENPEAAAAATS